MSHADFRSELRRTKTFRIQYTVDTSSAEGFEALRLKYDNSHNRARGVTMPVLFAIPMMHLEYCKSRLAALSSRTLCFHAELGPPYRLSRRTASISQINTLGFEIHSTILTKMFSEVTINLNSALKDMEQLERAGGSRRSFTEQPMLEGRSHLEPYKYTPRVILCKPSSDSRATRIMKRLETTHPAGAGVFKFTGISIELPLSEEEKQRKRGPEVFDRHLNFPFRESN